MAMGPEIATSPGPARTRPSPRRAGFVGMIAILAIAHLVMEFACGTKIAARPTDSPAVLVLLYSMCAFLTPVAIGPFADRARRAGPLAAAGCVLGAAGVLVSPTSLVTVVVLGLGNVIIAAVAIVALTTFLLLRSRRNRKR